MGFVDGMTLHIGGGFRNDQVFSFHNDIDIFQIVKCQLQKG